MVSSESWNNWRNNRHAKAEKYMYYKYCDSEILVTKLAVDNLITCKLLLHPCLLCLYESE